MTLKDDPTTAGVLQTIPILDASEVEARLAGTDLKAILADAFLSLANNRAVQPPQSLTLLPESAGDYIIYSAALDTPALFGVKVSPYLTGLAKAGEVPVTAYTILFSSQNGKPLALCDSLSLTTARTAATTSLALDYLAPSQLRKLAVIGSGPIALSHLEIELKSREWETVVVFSPGLAASETRSGALKERDPRIDVAPNARECVADADVVMLCTSSGTKVVDIAWLKEDVTVTSISTNVARAHEIDPADLARFHVFCDYRATAPLQAGEMVIAGERYGWSPASVIADLPELVAGTVQEIPSGRRFFRSTGLGLEDIAAAAAVLRMPAV